MINSRHIIPTIKLLDEDIKNNTKLSSDQVKAIKKSKYIIINLGLNDLKFGKQGGKEIAEKLIKIKHHYEDIYNKRVLIVNLFQAIVRPNAQEQMQEFNNELERLIISNQIIKCNEIINTLDMKEYLIMNELADEKIHLNDISLEWLMSKIFQLVVDKEMNKNKKKIDKLKPTTKTHQMKLRMDSESSQVSTCSNATGDYPDDNSSCTEKDIIKDGKL